MECPKCHSVIDDNCTVCPNCHKVLLLECPNCHEIGDSPVCGSCGYTILVKCAKCSKINPAINDLCSKCGFPTGSSLAYQECESDELADVTIRFNNLNKIKRLLKSKDMYNKFVHRLHNLLLSHFRNHEGKIINYKSNIYSVNFNKELSFPTSCNKAVRFALKIANAFTELNSNIIEEFRIPLGLNIQISKKSAEDLQKLSNTENNVKLLLSQKNQKKYLKGTQIILDQYVRDEISKDYKTDSLYTMEENGKTVMFYEVILDSYILPPDQHKEDKQVDVQQKNIKKQKVKSDKFSDTFNIFDINAKCNFERTDGINFGNVLNSVDFEKTKIISLRADYEYNFDAGELFAVCEDKGYKVIKAGCTESLNYKSWGVFSELFCDYFSISNSSKLNNFDKIDKNILQRFKPLFDLQNEIPARASSPEDARFAYMENWGAFFSTLKKTAVIIEGFEKLDDTSLQTLELYFDKYKKITPLFIFITNDDTPVHSKIKTLLRTPLYTEYRFEPVQFDKCLSTIKSDAGDFIASFYFDKIQENYKGSYLYFNEAFKYLKETDVIVDFENKIIVKDSKSVIIPADIKELYKLRMKNLSKNPDIAFALGYLYMLGKRVDISLLGEFGVKNPSKTAEILTEAGIATLKNNFLSVNHSELFEEVMAVSLKRDVEVFFAENSLKILANRLNMPMAAFISGREGNFKKEYLILLKNSNFVMETGDYDAYLKNCLGFLSLMDKLGIELSKEETDEVKKEVYNNILLCLYNYAPAKIYYIENILLLDAIQENDDEKISRLSNLMLQGALLSSNYSDAQGLLYNILSRMKDASLVINNAINTRFLLLSLVQIEILYYTGNYKQCADTADEILSVISSSNIEKIKPQNFSTDLFVSHLFDTFRLGAFSKIILGENDLEEFMLKIEQAFECPHPEKDALTAVRDYLSGKIYSIGNVEEYSSFSKTIFLILQEAAGLQNDYKRFAQNIFQAKLLAEDIHSYELKLLCDMLIGYAYLKVGNYEKAESIFNDIAFVGKNTDMYSIKILSGYFSALTEYSNGNIEAALGVLNDNFMLLRSRDNLPALFYVLNQSLYLRIAKAQEITSVDIHTEEKKLEQYSEIFNRILV